MTIDVHIALLRIGLAAVLGAVVGVEREWRHKIAGLKTNTLVAIGAASFAIMSDTFGPNNHNPAQLAAAVVTGIGFVGAGVILHRGLSVQGVTTAATLWANAGMGVAAGLGQFAVASTTFVGIIVVQFVLAWGEHAISRRSPRQYAIEIRVDCTPAALESVTAAWREFAAGHHGESLRQSLVRSADGVRWQASLVSAPSKSIDLGPIESKFLAIEGVRQVDVTESTPDSESV